MIVDEKGKLFGKVSVLDVAIVLLIFGLAVTFLYGKISKAATPLDTADGEFYMNLIVERVRNYTIDAIQVGDIVYEQGAYRLGEVVDIRTEPATELIRKHDGTMTVGTIEGRYNAYIIMSCYGGTGPEGFHIEGVKHVAVGDGFRIQTNRVLTSGRVFDLTETYPSK